jgi:hypothetical protein
MKVLEEGKWKQVWSMEMSCSEKQCGAKLLVEEADVKPFDYSSKNDFYAECAVCGARMSITSLMLPLRMQRDLNKKRKYSSSWD